MWTYSACLGILILGGLRSIAPCLPPALERRAVITILRPGSQGLNCRSFRFSHAPVLTISSTIGQLVGYLGGQFSQH